MALRPIGSNLQGRQGVEITGREMEITGRDLEYMETQDAIYPFHNDLYRRKQHFTRNAKSDLGGSSNGEGGGMPVQVQNRCLKCCVLDVEEV